MMEKMGGWNDTLPFWIEEPRRVIAPSKPPYLEKRSREHEEIPIVRDGELLAKRNFFAG
jgi:hypothetical protein